MKKLLKIIGIAIVAILAIGIIGGGKEKNNGKIGEVGETNNFSSQNTTSNSSEEAPKEEYQIQDEYHVGDILMDGDTKIVYITSGDYVSDNEFSQPEEGNKYIFMKMAFENTSRKSDTSISFYNFECYADGYNAEMYYGGDDDLSATLSPGRSTSGTLIFEVPENAEKIEVEYESNVWTQEKILFVFDGEKDSGYVLEKNTERSDSAVSVGESVETSSLKIDYVSCEEYVSDNMFIQPKENHHFVTCTFEVENIGSSDASITYFSFDCYADGIDCEQTFVRDDGLSATLSPGRKATGTVTFEIPNDATVVELELDNSFWTSNRIVFTIQ